MIFLYLVLNTFYSYFFLLKKRNFDLFTISYLSSLIYFLPAIVGVDIWNQNIHVKTYLVYIIVQLVIFFGALFNDHIVIRIKPPSFSRIPKYSYYFIFMISISTLFYILLFHGPMVFLASKSDMNMHPYVSIFWRVSSSLLLLYGYLLNNKKFLFFAALMLGLSFIAQDRTAVALALLTLFLLIFSGKKVSFLLKYRRLIPVFIFFTFAIMFGKSFHVMVNLLSNGMPLGDVIDIISPKDGQSFIINTEPFIIQLILNQVMILDYSINNDYLINFPLYLFPTTAPFGVDSGVFNNHIQHDIFIMYKDKSIAYNYWAEGYANGGWSMLVIFVVVWLLMIMLLNWGIRTQNIFFRGLFSIMGVYLAFYIHRNSLFSIMTYERHLFYFAMIAIIFGVFFTLFRKNNNN